MTRRHVYFIVTLKKNLFLYWVDVGSSPFCMAFACCPCMHGFFSRYSSFLPVYKHVSLISDSIGTESTLLTAFISSLAWEHLEMKELDRVDGACLQFSRPAADPALKREYIHTLYSLLFQVAGVTGARPAVTVRESIWGNKRGKCEFGWSSGQLSM